MPPSRSSTPDTSPAKLRPMRDTWSAIAITYAAFNRHEIPELTPDWVNIDHRRGAAFASGELIATSAPYGTSPDIKFTSRSCIG